MNIALSFLLLTGTLLAQSGQSEEIYGPPPPPPAPAHPVAYCPEPNYDWGTVYSGEEVVHTFVVYNKGGATLRIESVRPSCGCTASKYDREIPPGGKGGITLKMRTRGFTHRTQKRTTVTTNDPNNPRFFLTMGGDIKPLLKVEPSYFQAEGLKGETVTATVKLIRQVDKPIQIVEIKPMGTIKVTYDLKEIVKGKEYELVLFIDTEGIRTTYFYGQPVSLTLKVKVDGRIFDVPIRGRLKLVNTVNPSKQYLYFSRTVVERFYKEGGKPPSQTINVTGYKGRSFAIKKIEIRARKIGSFKETYLLEEPPIEVKADSTARAQKHTLTVSLRQVPEEKRKTTSCQIHIFTDDPDTPEVIVRATVYFPRKRGTPFTRSGSIRPSFRSKSTSTQTPFPSSTKKTATPASSGK